MPQRGFVAWVTTPCRKRRAAIRAAGRRVLRTDVLAESARQIRSELTTTVIPSMVDEALGQAEIGLAGVAGIAAQPWATGHAGDAEVLPARVARHEQPPAPTNHLGNADSDHAVVRADQAVAEIAKGIRTLVGLLTSELTSLRKQGQAALADIQATRAEIAATHREIRDTLGHCGAIQQRATRAEPERQGGEAEVIHENN